MPKCALHIATGVLQRTRPRPRFMLEHQHLARTQLLTVDVVAVLASTALAQKMEIIATFALVLETRCEALFRAGVGLWQRCVEALVVHVEDNEHTSHLLLRRYIEVFTRGAAFADGSPGV
jgi:hypothetical protein